MNLQVDKSRVRILVTDDEESIRTMLALTLKEDGWSVETAVNGRDGFEKLQKQPFHIVLSDIQMPEMTGIEFLEKVKSGFPNVEFIIMTSNATLETAMQAIKLGAYDYLQKPFEDLSVATKKMMQVAERIMLRQQNAELLKRLRKSTQDLKLLYEMVHHLNGVLEEDQLAQACLESLPKLFQEGSVKSAWLTGVGEGKWKVLRQYPEGAVFSTDEVSGTEDEIKAGLTGLRNLSCLLLKDEGKEPRLLIFESLSAGISGIFEHEVARCFEKVMRHQDVVSLASRDGLTKLYNHRYFQDRLRQELSQVKRQNGDLSVVLIDVDHFKKYNDAHGHPMGDQLLRELAALFDKESGRRDSDIVARYGGEEFVFLLPFTDFQGAIVKAERIRSLVEQHKFPHGETQPLGMLSLSIGVATFPQDAISPSTLIECADKALYQAKHDGRNRVVGFPQLRNNSNENIKKSEAPKTTLAQVLEPKVTDAAPAVVEAAVAIEVPVVAATPAVVETPFAIETPAPVVTDVAAPVLAEAPVVLNSELSVISQPSAVAEPVATEVVAPQPAMQIQEPVIAQAALPVEVVAPIVEVTPVVEAPPAVVVQAPAPVEAAPIEPAILAPAPVASTPAVEEKKSLRKKTIGPDVDVDSLVASIESVVDQVTATREAESAQTVSFVDQMTTESLNTKGKGHGSGGK